MRKGHQRRWLPLQLHLEIHTKGGHALALTTGNVKVEVMALPETTILLPTNTYFLNATLPYN